MFVSADTHDTLPRETRLPGEGSEYGYDGRPADWDAWSPDDYCPEEERRCEHCRDWRDFQDAAAHALCGGERVRSGQCVSCDERAPFVGYYRDAPMGDAFVFTPTYSCCPAFRLARELYGEFAPVEMDGFNGVIRGRDYPAFLS